MNHITKSKASLNVYNVTSVTKIISVFLCIVMLMTTVQTGVFGISVNQNSSAEDSTVDEEYIESIYFYSGEHSYDGGRGGYFSFSDYKLEPEVCFEAISISHNIYPVSLGFEYNSVSYNFLSDICNTNCTSYGKGWLPDCIDYLCNITFTDETVLYSYASGSFEKFTQTTERDEYEDPAYQNCTKWISEDSDTVVFEYPTAVNGTKYVMITSSETKNYDNLGRCFCTTDNTASSSFSIDFDSAVFEKINCITDGIGNEFRFTYTNGRLSSVSTYNSDNTAITAGDGVNSALLDVAFSYTNGNLTTFTYPDNETVNFEYDSNDNFTCFGTIDNRRLEVSYTNGKISHIELKAYDEESDSYCTGEYLNITVNGFVHTFTDNYGNTEVKTFNTDGEILTITDGDGNYLYGEPEEDGSEEETTEEEIPEEETTEEDEDEGGTDEPEDEEELTCPCTNCTDINCGCTCESEEDCTCIACTRNTSSVKDSFGNITAQNSFDGIRTLSELSAYTSNGAYMSSSTDSSGNTVYYTYSNAGFLTSVSAGGNTASMTYDAVGNLISLSQSVSGNTVSNVYSYSHDKIRSITHNGFSYTFEYDAWGNRTTVKVAGSVLEETEYDTGSDHDRITGINYANGQSVEYTYNSDGNITGVNYDNSANDRYTYTYDTDGNLTQIADNLAGTKTVYTESGTEIRKISDNTLLYSSILNDDGENELSLGSSDIVFTYDSEYNSVTGITTDSTEYTGETTITDEDNNEIDCSVSAATAVNTDWFGRVVSKSVTTDVYATDGENILDQTVSASTAVTYNDTATTASTQVSSYSTTVDGVTETEYYEYDSTGNISVIYHYTENGVRENLNRYFYDEAGQLTREDNRLGNFTTVYAYDVGGNVTSVTKYAYTENSDLSDLTPTETKTFTYRTSGWKDVLTAVNSDAVTTDSLGNVTSIANGQSYEWTAGRQLKKLTEADGDCYNYYYNADGYLSRFDVFNEEDEPQATYSYYWDGDKLSAVTIDNEDDNDYTTRIIYDSEGEATGFIVNERATYLYRKNYLGDVIAIYDDSGDEVIRYYYDAFGNPGAIAPEFENPSDAFGYLFIAAFMTAINPILYRGYIWTPVAGYSYYLGSRFYVPSLYRFMNADVYEDTGTGVVGTNMFAYCDNNPISKVDYDGKISVLTKLLNAMLVNFELVVYYYKDDLKEHIDISVNDTIYSYGTNGANYVNKFIGVQGYLYSGDTEKWHTSAAITNQYGSNIDKVKIKASYKEKLSMLIYLADFTNNCTYTKTPYDGIKQYRVTSGSYKKYYIYSKNCATFVRDFLANVFYLEVKKAASILTSPHQSYKTLITPSQIFFVAKQL